MFVSLFITYAHKFSHLHLSLPFFIFTLLRHHYLSSLVISYRFKIYSRSLIYCIIQSNIYCSPSYFVRKLFLLDFINCFSFLHFRSLAFFKFPCLLIYVYDDFLLDLLSMEIAVFSLPCCSIPFIIFAVFNRFIFLLEFNPFPSFLLRDKE